jgi:hypothetical protein
MVVRSVEQWQTSCRRAWIFHYSITISVMIAGILHNGDKMKLIPSRLRQVECSKVLINVLSPSDDGGTICCEANSTSFSLLCSNASSLPLYKQLTRLPDAWLIPLVPIILRGMLLIWETLFTNHSSESWSIYLKRFHFYMLLLSVRGFVLFLGFNWIQEQLFGGPPSECWFSNYTQRQRPGCHGIPFDFSDHIVLYLGQILAIPLTEVMYSWMVPFSLSGKSRIFSVAVLIGLLYLYFITLLGEFQTAAYYHTRQEILAGYIISLTLQFPLSFIQCSTSWSKLRNNVFRFSHEPNQRQD